ncbi:hypothetical protein SteCoe_11994 [Stentor coeruleus]|uniref:Ubiquitin-like domain-containing protein n=1 Tax=Stentor coeruleus TaxID=5963 RepID=A0A1R2CC08_9CILI|nr:hypothetical protein SteCoe_11994 [Stentor coeruleus]
METDEKWVYTPWGYAMFLYQDSLKATVKLHWGGLGYLNPSSLTSSIHFSIKLFSASRDTLEYQWEITQDFSLLYSLIQKQFSLTPKTELSIYYIKGKLIKILPSDCPLNLKLKNNIKFLGIIKTSITSDDAKNSQNLEAFRL